jgi:hypothetical protein
MAAAFVFDAYGPLKATQDLWDDFGPKQEDPYDMGTASTPLHFAPTVTYAPQSTFTALNTSMSQAPEAWTIAPDQIFSGPGSTSNNSTFVGSETQSLSSCFGETTWPQPPSRSSPSETALMDDIVYPSEWLDTHNELPRRRRHDSTQRSPQDTSAATSSTTSTTTRRRTGRRRTSEDLAPDSARAVYLKKNRKAASKCRSKQKQEQEQLVIDAREYERRNKVLKAEMELLKADKRNLMDMVGTHADCPDQRMQIYVQQEADRLVKTNDRESEAGISPKEV